MNGDIIEVDFFFKGTSQSKSSTCVKQYAVSDFVLKSAINQQAASATLIRSRKQLTGYVHVKMKAQTQNTEGRDTDQKASFS